MKFTIHTNADYGTIAVLGSSTTLEEVIEAGYDNYGNFLQKSHNALVVIGTPRGMEHLQLNFNIVDFFEDSIDAHVIDTDGCLIIEDWHGTQYARIPCPQRVSLRATEDPLYSIFDIWIGFEK